MRSLEIVRNPVAMRALADDVRRDGKTICLVPTMGALHEGHLSLLRIGRGTSDVLILSIFVNPIQFGPTEDFERYPRDENADIRKAQSCGVNFAFCPDIASMYTPQHTTRVSLGPLSEPLCGRSRPGHFEAVATIVAKLFHIVSPHIAIFGQKDYQQLAVIRQMVADLDFGVKIVTAPIVRAPDGLALSSRNAYLSEPERNKATALYRALQVGQSCFQNGEQKTASLIATARQILDSAPEIEVEYLELRDADNLSAIDTIQKPSVLAVAAKIGTTRLIDNVMLVPSG